MAYSKTNWQDLPSTATPLSASNLNKIENELESLDINKVNKNEVNFIHLIVNATTFSFSIGNLTGGFQTYIIYGGWENHFVYLLTVHPDQQVVMGYSQIFNNTGEANINSVTMSNNTVTINFSSTIWGGVHIIGEQAQST